MKRVAIFVLATAISGCASYNHRVLFTPQQVIDSVEPIEAKDIAVIEKNLHQARRALILLMQSNQIDQESADLVSAQMRAVDYYICKGWAAMVEGDTHTRDEATVMAQRGYGVLFKNLQAIIDKSGI